MTSLTEEHEEQRRWRFRPEKRNMAPQIARLVDGEFTPPAMLAAQQGEGLSRMALFASSSVPYWSALFRERGIDPKILHDVGELERLPVLNKLELARHNPRLRARRLPPGERVFGWTASSGTTGQPAKVLHSVRSNLMFTLLRQRHYRWHRMDPEATFASIRLPSQLPIARGEAPLANGITGRRPAWRYASAFFETGPYIFFSVTNPIERQLEWLAEECPHYLETYSETLEHLVFACEGRWPAPSIRKLQAISEQLTPSMRRRIEATAGVAIEQSYGLNEIGLVGVRCAGGRYHVHAEHCVVEIVDEDGRRCAPGATGRVVVSTLTNAAMPLFRYDTGDMAAAVQGPCPCGRTLPAFGDLAGRYSRIAYLPQGTLALVGALREALETIPPLTARHLRQFQIHQFRDESFELRLLTAGALPPEFETRIRVAWTAATNDKHSLRIVLVDVIHRSPGGKFQDFTSDFMPNADSDNVPPPATGADKDKG
ncbi:MAG: AMP-binding protein [Burkholderiales bacterium]